VIADFLESHDEFVLDDLALDGSQVARPVAASAAATSDRAGAGSGAQSLAGTVLTLPHRDRTAGFFIARLRRS
jgi:16S rRNA C967 or C1407 C5-methylase (RsmB/RsmF family)